MFTCRVYLHSRSPRGYITAPFTLSLPPNAELHTRLTVGCGPLSRSCPRGPSTVARGDGRPSGEAGAALGSSGAFAPTGAISISSNRPNRVSRCTRRELSSSRSSCCLLSSCSAQVSSKKMRGDELGYGGDEGRGVLNQRSHHRRTDAILAVTGSSGPFFGPLFAIGPLFSILLISPQRLLAAVGVKLSSINSISSAATFVG